MCAMLPAVAGCNSSDTPAPDPGTEGKHVLQIVLSELEATSVTATVTSDDPELTYCTGPMTEAEYAACGGDVARHVATIIRKAQDADPSVPLAEVVARLQRTGTTQQTYSGLTPETKYYVTAIGLDDGGACTTEAVVQAFTTSPATPVPEGRFAIEVSTIAQTEATVAVTPEDDTLPYYFDIITSEDYRECKGDLSVIMAELIAFIREQNPDRSIEAIAAVLQSRGPASDRIGNLPPSTDFYAFAIGLGDDGACLTTAAVTPFRTLDPGNPADCTFQIEVTNNDSQSVFVDITPSDGTVGYFSMVIGESEFAGDANLTARIQQAIRQVAAEQQMSVEQAVEALCWRGASRALEDGLEPSTAYYAVAYALAADASAAGPLTKKRFITLGENISAATCTIDCDSYFDGDALYALDPVKYADLQGRVYVPATARPSKDAVHWYTALGRGDMTDPGLYPDDATINALLQGGTADKIEMHYIANWGEATLLAVAADEINQFGTVFRKALNFTPEGASPVSELAASALQPSVQTVAIDLLPPARPASRVQASVAGRLQAAHRASAPAFRCHSLCRP